MATLKLYTQNASSPYTPATIRGAWNKTTTSGTGALGTSKSGAIGSGGVAVGSTNANWDVLVTRWSYILSEDIKFSGSVSGVIGIRENAGLNGYLHIHIFATQGQSDTLRGTLLTDLIDTNEVSTSAATAGEAFSGTLSDLQCYSGDVLVVELGYKASSTSVSYAGYIYYGGTSSTDLADNGDASLYPGWIQLEYIISVGAETQSKWNVKDAISNTNQALWNVKDTVGIQTETIWNIRDTVFADIQSLWNVLFGLTAGADIQSLWNIRAIASSETDISWRTLDTATSNIQALWYTKDAVSADAEAIWRTLDAVATESQQLWNTLTVVSPIEFQALWNVYQGILLLPDTNVEVSMLDVANKVYVVVEDSDPLIVGSATNDTVAPKYSVSPREVLVLIKAGDATLCSAVASAQLTLYKNVRYKLTGLSVPIRYGLGIRRGMKIRVAIPRASIDGIYAVRRLEHDFGRNVTSIDVGEFSAPRDDESALVEVAKHLAQLQKETSI